MVREGYKQTEVGVIPKDWNVDSLANLTQAKRPISYGIVQTGRQVPGGVSCIRVVDIVNGRINDDDLITTSQEISNSYKRTILKIGDLIIALRGKIGELALVPEELEGANLTRGVALIALQENCSSRFYHQYLSSSGSKIRLQNSLNGSALQELPIATLRSFLVAIPPLPEQRSIAQALSDVDALITALDKAIAKKRAIKTATIQQLLTGKKRLPGFGEGKGYQQTEVGVIPEDWEVATYGEHFNVISGLGFKKSEYTEYGVSLLRIDNVSYGKIAWDSIAFLPQEYIEKYKDLVIDQDDILLALNRPITNGKLKIAVAKESDVPAILYQRVGKIIFTSQKYDKHYAFYLLSKFIKQFVEESSVGSDQPFISTNNLKKYKIVLPLEIEEQRAIATVLSDMDIEIAALETRLTKTQSIKQGMMQELLTGRTRLI